MVVFDEEPQELHSPPAEFKCSWIPLQHITTPSNELQKLLYTPPVSLSVHVPCDYVLYTLGKAWAIVYQVDEPPIIIILTGLYLKYCEVTVFLSDLY